MVTRCWQCPNVVLESMGSVKAGDFSEAIAGKRPWRKVRVLCGTCATFYANTRWRFVIIRLGMKLSLPMRRICVFIARHTGISFLNPA